MSHKRKAERSEEDRGDRKRNNVVLSVDSMIEMAEHMIVQNYSENKFLLHLSKLEKLVHHDNPKDTRVLLLEAKFNLARGRHRLVRICVTKCYSLNPSDMATREFAIRWRLKKSDSETDWKLKADDLRWAMDECVLVLKQKPNLASVIYLKGLTHHQLGDHEKAIAEFDKCFLDDVYGLKSVWQAYNSMMCMVRTELKTDEQKKQSFTKAGEYLDRILTMSSAKRDQTMVAENKSWIKHKLESMNLESVKEKEKEEETALIPPNEKEQEKEKELIPPTPKEKEKDILFQMALMGPIYQNHAATMAEQHLNQSAIVELLQMKPDECDSILMGFLGFSKLHCVVFRNRLFSK